MRHPLPCLLLALLLLTGCPDPPTPTPPAPNGGQASPTDPTGPGDAAANPGDPAPAGPADGAPAAVAAWTVIPSSSREAIYPMLQVAATWPAPEGLRAPSAAPAAQQPSATRVRLLKELVGQVVAERLRPNDMDSALGLDGEGRLFLKLGEGKASGSASLEVKPAGLPPERDFPVLELVLADPRPGPRSLEDLRRRVAAVLVPGLAAELKREGHALEAHPQLATDAEVAAMAELDRQGFGAQFPYLYAYATDQHLVVLLQEVPHRSMSDPPR